MYKGEQPSSGFRFQWSDPWGFESPLAHKTTANKDLSVLIHLYTSVLVSSGCDASYVTAFATYVQQAAFLVHF